MPIYEYVCNECKHLLEALQKMRDTPLSVCPACGKSSLVKKISAPGFRLGGSGWYETDFKSDKQKNLVESEGGDKNTKSSTDSDASSKKETSKDKVADKGAAA